MDLVGNSGTSAQVAVTVRNSGSGDGAVLVATSSSETSNDGCIKATADGSGSAVGTLESLYGLAIGRGTDGKHNRSVLSFDTSDLPDTAQIVSATV